MKNFDKKVTITSKWYDYIECNTGFIKCNNERSDGILLSTTDNIPGIDIRINNIISMVIHG